MHNVELLTPAAMCDLLIKNAVLAGLTCTANTAKLNDPNFDRVAFLTRRIEEGHESVIEHINLTFEIQGISRALLQELARHRHVSLSVESTRWTLGKTLLSNINVMRWAGHAKFEHAFDEHLDKIPAKRNEFAEKIRQLQDVMSDVFYTAAYDENREVATPDFMKYFLPELTPTNLVMTCNLRELRHIYKLRSKPPALQEFQVLCAEIQAVLPLGLQKLLTMAPRNTGGDTH